VHNHYALYTNLGRYAPNEVLSSKSSTEFDTILTEIFSTALHTYLDLLQPNLKDQVVNIRQNRNHDTHCRQLKEDLLPGIITKTMVHYHT